MNNKANTIFSKLKNARAAAAPIPDLVTRAQKAAESILSGDNNQRRAGEGEQFWQYREYDPTDRPQDIDWRQSAKGDKVFIRQREWQTTQTTTIWASNYSGMGYQGEAAQNSKADHAHILTLALSVLISRSGGQVKPLAGSYSAGRSTKALQRIEREIIGENNELPSQSHNLSKRSNLILSSDFLMDIPQIQKSFGTFAGFCSQALIIQVLDPDELNLPFEGRTIFKNDNENHEVSNVEEIRKTYQSRITEHTDKIAALCKKKGWLYHLHCTDRSIQSSLLSIWDEFYKDAKA